MTLLGFEIKDGESSGSVTENECAYRIHVTVKVRTGERGSARFDTGTASTDSVRHGAKDSIPEPHLESADSVRHRAKDSVLQYRIMYRQIQPNQQEDRRGFL